MTGLHRALAPSGSFTERVVAELAATVPERPCCRTALVDGMRLAGSGGDLVTTRLAAARAAVAALHADGIAAPVEAVASARRHRYRIRPSAAWPGSPPPPAPGSSVCCARSRLRGLLLAAGSVSRPDGPAHVELLMGSAEAARRTLADLERIGIPARAVRRRGRQVVEVRSVAGLATLLSSVGAPQARLELEAGRVVGEVRSAVSRQLNAEIANLRRSAEAAVIQIEAIDRLRRDRRSWDALPPALREAADVRRRHPQATLESLADGVGCSRSAMAGRLHRLVIAGSP
jgi:hypothetical protein